MHLGLLFKQWTMKPFVCTICLQVRSAHRWFCLWIYPCPLPLYKSTYKQQIFSSWEDLFVRFAAIIFHSLTSSILTALSIGSLSYNFSLQYGLVNILCLCLTRTTTSILTRTKLKTSKIRKSSHQQGQYHCIRYIYQMHRQGQNQVLGQAPGPFLILNCSGIAYQPGQYLLVH